MNTKITPELIKTLTGIAAGKPWQRNAHTVPVADAWTDMDTYADVWNSLYKGFPIRLKPFILSRSLPGFRPLAENEQWHRLDFTEEMLPEGWRPLLNCECDEGGDEIFQGGEWRLRTKDDYKFPATADQCFQRTRRPLPTLPQPEVWVPLEPSDVPPGSAIRRVGFPHWALVLTVNDEELSSFPFGPDPVTTTYKWLFENGEILRPGSMVWKPCKKLGA